MYNLMYLTRKGPNDKNQSKARVSSTIFPNMTYISNVN